MRKKTPCRPGMIRSKRFGVTHAVERQVARMVVIRSTNAPGVCPFGLRENCSARGSQHRPKNATQKAAKEIIIKGAPAGGAAGGISFWDWVTAHPFETAGLALIGS